MTEPLANIPFSQEAEESVLGAILISPAAGLDVPFLKPDHFFILRHRLIYEAILSLLGRSEPPDFITVQNELRSRGKLQDVGGPAYILHLINNTPTSIHAVAYAKLVYRAAIRRQMIAAADELRRAALDEMLSLEQVSGQAQTIVQEMIGASSDRHHEHTMADVVDELLTDIEEQLEHPERRPTVTTGFRELDYLLGGGAWAEDLLVVAGRPGMGKTALLINLALQAARVGKRVGVISLEMNAKSLVRRMIAMETGINLLKLRSGNLSQNEWAKVLPAAAALRPQQILTNDQPTQTVAQVHACFRRWQLMGGIDVAFVDYLGLLHSPEHLRTRRADEGRVRELDLMMRELKEMARTLGVPVWVAAQVSRKAEDRADKRPTLSDLRESGGIENTADVVAFLYRDVVYNGATESPNKAEIIIAKHRNGPTDTISLHYERSLTKFADARTQKINLSSL